MLDEKLIIKQFLENQKLALPGNLNAANLTLVLRSLGFFLNEFDSTGGDPDDTNLSIEIKCAKSGIISKLYLPHHDCFCQGTNPPEDKAYWEVHGNQPKSPSCSNSSPGGSTIVHETATNLLPEADHTWKILSKNMFNFMLRMRYDIAQYKDEQNNMQYGEPPVNELTVNNHKTELCSDINEELSPVFQPTTLDTPFSTPLSSINVTPIVSTNGPAVTVSAPNNNGPSSLESTTSSCHEESMVIALVMEAKSKLDQALLRMKFTSTEDLFNGSGPLKLSRQPTLTPNNSNLLQANKPLLRRRSTNSSISSNSSLKTAATSKLQTKLPGRFSTGSADTKKIITDYKKIVTDTKKIVTDTKKNIKSPPKKVPKVFITQTRTSALRNQKPKN